MKKIILSLLVFISMGLKAQTPNLNQQKYWDYRDRFKKWYIKIGKQQGESQVMDLRGMDKWKGARYTSHGTYVPAGSDWLVWGDNPNIQLGYYMQVLATEYALLKRNHQDTRGTLVEIYYALKAIDRIDSVSDAYIKRNTSLLTNNVDGLLLRSDVAKTPTFTKDWLEEDSSFIIDSKGYKTYNEAYDWNQRFDGSKGWNDSIVYNPENIMSVDEIAGLTIGVWFLNKYVDDIFVKPMATDEGFNVVTHGKQIIKRIIDYCYETKYLDTCWLAGQISGLKLYNWGFTNPADSNRETDDNLAKRISNDFPTGGTFWYGNATLFSKVCQNLYGTYYDDQVIGDNCHIDWSSIFVPGYNLYEIGLDAFNIYCSQYIWHVLKTRHIDHGAILTAQAHEQWPWIDSTKSLRITYADSIFYTKVTDYLPSKSMYTYMATMGVIAGELTDSSVLYYGETIDCRNIALLKSLITGVENVYGKHFFEVLLNDAPIFENPGVFYDSTSHNNYYNANYWGTNNIWHRRPIQNDAMNQIYKGYRNGLDYMMLYNMYHLFYDSTTSYKESPCDCYKYQFDTITNQINNAKILKRVHPDYKYKGIPEPRYINRATTITADGSLTTYSDLYICHRPDSSPTWLTCVGPLTVGHPSDTQKVADLVIRGGNTVHINFVDGTNCTVNKGSRIIMEPESQIIVERGGSLILKTGSNLINKGGIIHIKAGAYFQIDSGAVANIWNNGSVIIDSGATLVVNNTGLLSIDSNANLVYTKRAYLYLNGPSAQLYINAKLLLRGDTAYFKYYKDLNHMYQQAGFCTFAGNAEVQVETATKGNLYFVGEDSNDVVLKIKGTVSLPDSVYYPNHYIDSVVVINGKIDGIGTTPRLTTGSKLLMRYAIVETASLRTLGQYTELYRTKFKNGGYANEEAAGYNIKEQKITECQFIGTGISINGGISKYSGCDFFNETVMNCTKVRKLTLYNNSFFNNMNGSAIYITDNTKNQMATKHANYFLETNNFIKNKTAIEVASLSNTASDLNGASINMRCCMFKDNIMAIDGYDYACINMCRTYLCDSIGGGDNSFWNNRGDTTATISYPIKVADIYLRNGHNSFVYDMSYPNIYKFIAAKFTSSYRTNITYCSNTSQLHYIKIDSNFWYPQKVFNGQSNNYVDYISAEYSAGGTGPNPPPAIMFDVNGLVLDTTDIICLKSVVQQPFKIKSDGTLKKYWSNVNIGLFYPNPNIGVTTVKLDLNNVPTLQAYYIIYDAQGNPIYTSASFGLTEGSNWIQMSHNWLLPGSYYIVFYFSDGTYVYTISIVV